jgi:dolichol-phosphate mannosyltransferase
VVSITFPVWNEEGNLEVLYERVTQALVGTGVAYELVFVDNGSTDGSLAVIKALSDRSPCVRYVSLSRNFGHQAGLFAGMSNASGDAVITMDSDLPHPASLAWPSGGASPVSERQPGSVGPVSLLA